MTAAFEAAGLVYLATTVYGPTVNGTVSPSVDVRWNPGFASERINDALDNALSVLRMISESDADRSMVFPLCLIGSAVPFERPMDRMWFVQRFASMDGKERLGNGANAEAIMKVTWQAAQDFEQGRAPRRSDWIDCMGCDPVLLA